MKGKYERKIIMLKAIYKNPRSSKLYLLDKNEETDKLDIYTVYDDAKQYDDAPIKADKNGKCYKVLNVAEHVTKAGHKVYKTIKFED